MASSSKTINMPLIFAISIGATVSLVAITMFGLAWYQYESRVVLREQVLMKDGQAAPTHDRAYDERKAEQLSNLGDIDAAMVKIVAAYAKDKPAGHDGYSDGH